MARSAYTPDDLVATTIAMHDLVVGLFSNRYE
jgi:hypothetical protein